MLLKVIFQFRRKDSEKVWGEQKSKQLFPLKNLNSFLSCFLGKKVIFSQFQMTFV